MRLTLTNDLFSFRAECNKNDFVNAVSAFIVRDGPDLQGAVDQATPGAGTVGEQPHGVGISANVDPQGVGVISE